MANKKVYFSVLNILEKGTESSVKYDKTIVKEEIINIIDSKAVKCGAYRTIDVTQDGEQLRTIVDVSSYKNDMLFCRISRQRPTNSLLKRDYETFEEDEVLNEEEVEKKGIEAFTFCLLYYATGIFSIVSAMGAPDQHAITRLFSLFSNEYCIEFTDIPNANAINSIYFGENPEISKIEIEMPVPSAEIMATLLGWERDEVTDAVLNNSLKTTICIKGPSRAAIVRDENATSIIDKLREILQNRRISVTGKAHNIKSKDYDLNGEFFSYPIDVRTYKTIDGNRYYYTIGDLTTIYREELLNSYRENSDVLKAITGR